jgi:hypothetical protein
LLVPSRERGRERLTCAERLRRLGIDASEPLVRDDRAVAIARGRAVERDGLARLTVSVGKVAIWTGIGDGQGRCADVTITLSNDVLVCPSLLPSVTSNEMLCTPGPRLTVSVGLELGSASEISPSSNHS